MSFIFKKLFQWIQSVFFNKQLEISIVGLQNAGKSTLVNSISTGNFTQDTIPTIGFNHRQVKKGVSFQLGKISMKLWDLGGQNRFRDSWQKYCRDSDVIIFVIDSFDRGIKKQAANVDLARAQLHHLLSHDSLKGIALLVLGNKNDIPQGMKQQQIVQKLRLKQIKDRKVVCYSISAKNQNNLDSALKWLSELPSK